MDPWGTPEVILRNVDLDPDMSTYCCYLNSFLIDRELFLLFHSYLAFPREYHEEPHQKPLIDQEKLLQ